MSTKNTKSIPAKTEKTIYQEANSACPFCDERDVATFETHHIKNRAEGGGNEPENLILCCSNCHSKITAAVISIHEVYRAKFALRHATEAQQQQQQPPAAKARKPKPSNVLQFKATTNNGVVANTVHFVTSSKSVKVQPATGIVAADGDERSYVKHLIDRYHEFKKADKTVTDFSYAVLYTSIKNRFKCKWDFVPSSRFLELVKFLQDKIDGTILGKNRCRKRLKNYSTYDEYLAGYR